MGNLIICGDFAPNLKNQEIIATKTPEYCFGMELAEKIKKADCVVLNLETTLTTSCTPKLKRGQINQTIPEITNLLKKANIKLCCLANNHIIDNGNKGIISTINVLKASDISYIGAGKTLEEACKPFVINIGNRKVRILNISNNEFNQITESEYGTNVFDTLETFDYIREQSKFGDYLVIIYHGGVEYYQYPSPYLQRICRKMVDCGANIVTCQHSHCIGTYECYKNATIVYGQGNFLFDDSDKELEKTAILLDIDPNIEVCSFIPVIKNDHLVRIAKEEEASFILQEIEKRHKQIAEDKFIELQWEKFCESQKSSILAALTGNNFIYRVLNRITKGYSESLVYSSFNKMRIYNIITTPALFEILQGVMKKYDKKR